jgi:hypothetical protein
MRRITAVSLIAGSTLLACTSDHSIAPNPAGRSPGITAALVDGGHGGNPRFFFLPPMVPPQPVAFSHAFDATVKPVVEICTAVFNGYGACQSDLASPFTTLTGPFDPSKVFTNVQVVPQLQFYFVLWRPNWSTLNAAAIHRITVKASFPPSGPTDVRLGVADVKVVSSEDEFEAVWASKQFVPLLRGGLLAIIFRIEQGAATASQCANPDCVQTTIQPNPNNRLDVVTPSGQAAASFPAGYFSNSVTLTISRVPEGCFSTSPAPQPAPEVGCYSFSTDRPLDNPLQCDETAPDPTKCARVEVCPTFDLSLPGHTDLRLFRSDAGKPVEELREALASLTNCVPPPNLGLRPLNAPRIGELAHAGWRRVVNAVGWLAQPRPLYGSTAMGHLGVGGLTCCFSNIGWALVQVHIPTGSVTSPLIIDGLEGTATANLTFGTTSPITGLQMQGWINQGSVRRAAGTSDFFSCTGGTCITQNNVSSSRCVGATCSFNFVAGNPSEAAILTCGPATAEVDLIQGTTLLSTFRTPITLTVRDGASCP